MDPDVVVVAEAPSSEQLEMATDAQTAAAEAAVEIAQIAADRDVAIAEINAETTETVVEAQTADDEDVAWLRAELDGLRTSYETNAARLSDAEMQIANLTETVTAQAVALSLLTPPQPSAETPPAEVEPAAPAPDMTNAGESAARTENVPEVPATPRRKRVWL